MGAGGVSSVSAFVEPAVDSPLTFPVVAFVFLNEVFLAVFAVLTLVDSFSAAKTTLFSALGVGDTDHAHAPPSQTQDCPSGAVPYAADSAIT